jgi:hypothetical protein
MTVEEGEVIECSDYIAPLTMGDALAALKDGKKVARKGWNGKGMHVRMSKQPIVGYNDYLIIVGVDGMITPWISSHTDILAEDWYILED